MARATNTPSSNRLEINPNLIETRFHALRIANSAVLSPIGHVVWENPVVQLTISPPPYPSSEPLGAKEGGPKPEKCGELLSLLKLIQIDTHSLLRKAEGPVKALIKRANPVTC